MFALFVALTERESCARGFKRRAPESSRHSRLSRRLGRRTITGAGAEVQLTLDLDQVRRELEAYRQSVRTRLDLTCPGPIPDPELKDLAVVAFVQDDVTKRVLHAVETPFRSDAAQFESLSLSGWPTPLAGRNARQDLSTNPVVLSTQAIFGNAIK